MSCLVSLVSCPKHPENYPFTGREWLLGPFQGDVSGGQSDRCVSSDNCDLRPSVDHEISGCSIQFERDCPGSRHTATCQHTNGTVSSSSRWTGLARGGVRQTSWKAHRWHVTLLAGHLRHSQVFPAPLAGLLWSGWFSWLGSAMYCLDWAVIVILVILRVSSDYRLLLFDCLRQADSCDRFLQGQCCIFLRVCDLGYPLLYGPVSSRRGALHTHSALPS
jgi:hypothetical protein